ncbi:hypothetical protein AB833_16160 [Chromatiales bacterium (ex Bugula neritina AB1)]|nr:hypothetical protein AB833_16160 [Chromatiales bacterium (ex Bugula neritina AB1)]
MLWVLWDILLPVLLAFCSGVMVGWLLWRWRRQVFDSDSIDTMRRDNARYRSDIQQLRARNAQLAERQQIANEAGRAESRMSAPLNRSEVYKERETMQRNTPVATAAQYQTARMRHDNAVDAKELASELAQLQKTIALRDKMIATLQQSLGQYGDQSDLIALTAELAMRDRKIDALENMLDQVRH